MRRHPKIEEEEIRFPKLEFTQISDYIGRSQKYYQNLFVKLYFLNKSNSNYSFILRNIEKFNELNPNSKFVLRNDYDSDESKNNYNLLVKFDPPYFDNGDCKSIFEILIESPSTLDDLVASFSNDKTIEDFIANVYFPSQFAFFMCSFFQDKAHKFIISYFQKCPDSQFVFKIAASFIASSNKFKESLLNTYIQNKAKDNSQGTDFHILIQSFFESLHHLTSQQCLVLKEAVLKSKQKSTIMILKFILSPIVRSWEYSDFFVGTDILYSSYSEEDSNIDDIERCQLLKMLEKTDDSTLNQNSNFFEGFYSDIISGNLVSYQDTIDLANLINIRNIKIAITSLDHQINEIINIIYCAKSSKSELNIQQKIDKFKISLKQSKDLFKFNLSESEIEISSNTNISKNYKCPKEYEDDFYFFQKTRVQASETLQDFSEFYDISLKKSLGFGSKYHCTIIDQSQNLNQIKKKAISAYKEEIKFAQTQRNLIGQRMNKARLLKDEIKSAENLVNDTILKLVFRFKHKFNFDNLIKSSSEKDQDLDAIIQISKETAEDINSCFKTTEDRAKLMSYIEDFLINCKKPDEILSFLASKNESYHSFSTRTYASFLFNNEVMMILKFERAKTIFIFSNRKFQFIENTKLSINNDKISNNFDSFNEVIKVFKNFGNVGALLGSRINISQAHLRGLHMIHIIRIMNIILQIKYSFFLNNDNEQYYFSDSQIKATLPEFSSIPSYLFLSFVNPTLDFKDEKKNEYFFTTFQIFFKVCELISAFVQSGNQYFKFVDENIISTIKNSLHENFSLRKKISDRLKQDQSTTELNEDINDFNYMKIFAIDLMDINNFFANFLTISC